MSDEEIKVESNEVTASPVIMPEEVGTESPEEMPAGEHMPAEDLPEAELAV